MIVVFFAILIGSIVVGIPIGFSIFLSAFLFLIIDGFPIPGIVVQRMVAGVDSFPLLALPMFILAGNLMAFGTTERLMRLANALLAHVKGGLAMAGVVAATFFSSISGSGAATCAAVGSIVQPEMTRKGYDKGFSASVIAGSGALGIVIPPSLPMVIFGVTAGVSIGDLFLAGIVPGLLTSALLLVYCAFIARRSDFPPAAQRASLPDLAAAIRQSIMPLLMPVIILGGILSGMFTPTESAVVAVAYALFLSVVLYRELSIRDLGRVLLSSAKGSAVVLFIIAASSPFSWVMAMERIPQALSAAITDFAPNEFSILVMLILFILALGTFMETIAIIVIMTPIFMTLVNAIGMHPIHFGVILMIGLAIGGATPPLSVNLFVTCRIAGISIERCFPYILQVVAFMIAAMVITIAFPGMSLWPTW